MKTVGQFPRQVREIENCWIELSDGCRLAARVWLPSDAADDPVPAILEYLPYRKRDGTAERDELTHPYFAGHGYACLRVDMRGNGESDGQMWDEYLKQEQDDALEVIDWITQQPWCSGTVGMIGISWGGFNGLQVAARRPAALKAIVTICSTDDRYADDIHYKGGCLLNENLGWATTMLSFSSRPPDPQLVGDGWRETWLRRLENLPLLAETWLSHPHRDAYWRHGSVCEDFTAIEAAVFAVGGWGDAYSNAVPRILAGLDAPALGLIGPWIHKYPHFALPAPRIGFLQECLRWWDHWLKGRDSGIMEEPVFRAYMMELAPPRSSYDERPGRWVAEAAWPPSTDDAAGIAVRVLALNDGGAGAGVLESQARSGAAMMHRSPQDVGAACGEYCAMWLGPQWPSEQRYDDAVSLSFDGPPLDERIEIFGAPVVHLDLAVDRPQAFVAVRLCDVAPSGASTRITYGILNLTHRDGHGTSRPMRPGQPCQVRVQLDDIAYALPPGHRLRVSISTSYWPLIWPSPEPVELTLFSGSSRLDLPLRTPGGDEGIAFDEAEAAPSMAVQELRPSSTQRRFERDLESGESLVHVFDDFGEQRMTANGLACGSISRETYRIHPDDPLCASVEIHWTQTLEREHWQLRTECRARQWADREHFFLEAEVEAFEAEKRVFHKRWETSVPRDGV